MPAGVPTGTGSSPRRPPLDVQPPAAEDVALLQYTGGTTGTPKAAVLTHRNLVANVVQGFTWAGFRQGRRRSTGILPFFHAFGLTFCLTLPGYIGATLVAFPQFDPASVVGRTASASGDLPARRGPHVRPGAGRARRGGEEAADGVRSIRVSFAGAMPISQATADRWEAATGGLLIEGYGMTEASPIALGNPCSDRRRPGTLGLPFPSTDIRVVSQDDPTVDVSAEDDETLRGELLLRAAAGLPGLLEPARGDRAPAARGRLAAHRRRRGRRARRLDDAGRPGQGR